MKFNLDPDDFLRKAQEELRKKIETEVLKLGIKDVKVVTVKKGGMPKIQVWGEPTPEQAEKVNAILAKYAK